MIHTWIDGWNHKRTILELVQLAEEAGLAADERVRAAKELIRCARTHCGNAGACDGKGSAAYPCPLHEENKALVRHNALIGLSRMDQKCPRGTFCHHDPLCEGAIR